MPRMRCEKAFLNNATYTVPARLAIKVKSDTDDPFGRWRSQRWSTRSRERRAAESGQMGLTPFRHVLPERAAKRMNRAY